MYYIKCINRINPAGMARFGEGWGFSENIENPDGILVRSASLHEMDFSENTLAIARAGAGVNNIPIQKCTERGIVVFNTPGANANAVKELVLCALLLTSRKILPAAIWLNTLKDTDELSKMIEEQKGGFSGPEIYGKTLGVIGLGAIGSLVANTAQKLGMTVYGYDPYLSVESAWRLSSAILRAKTLEELCTKSDFITLHLPLNAETKGIINKSTIGKMKNGARLLNFARGELVNSTDVLTALRLKQLSAYATDFPENAMIGAENVIALPHLGASTPESEENCAVMAADEMKDYLENGNIKNSVNFPDVSMERTRETTRICLIHRNIPNTIAVFAATCGRLKINIENMQSRSCGDYAYTILDISGHLPADTDKILLELEPIIKVRILT